MIYIYIYIFNYLKREVSRECVDHVKNHLPLDLVNRRVLCNPSELLRQLYCLKHDDVVS